MPCRSAQGLVRRSIGCVLFVRCLHSPWLSSACLASPKALFLMSMNASTEPRPRSSTTSTAATLPEPTVETGTDEETTVVPTSAKDFGFIPIPRRVRYDPQSPAHFGLLMNIMFGVASTFSTSALTPSTNHELTFRSRLKFVLLPTAAQ